MGQAALAAITAFGKMQCLDSCAKYVLNSCHSECHMSDCCDCTMDTTEVDLPEEHTEVELEVEGCFGYHKSS